MLPLTLLELTFRCDFNVQQNNAEYS